MERANQSEKPLRVAAYCRVSTMLETQRSSIENQREHYTTLITSHPGWILAGIYLDAGWSGTEAENRPALQRLFMDCQSHKIDLILTKSISRFSRNTVDCLEMIRALTKLGVALFFEKENIHTGTMGSELMLSLLACFAQSESQSISNNTRWGIRKRFQSGTYVLSVPPYGYRNHGGILTIQPDEAEVVRKIFRLSLAGKGMNSIAKTLAQEGIPGPRGGQWNHRTLWNIVHNPAYKGDLLCQKTYVDAQFKEQINRGELDQYYWEGHHAPIISPETFDRAQAVLRQRARKISCADGRKEKRCAQVYTFSGILHCADCDCVMRRVTCGDKPVYWNCPNHTKKCCRMRAQPERDLKRAFLNCLNKLAWSQGRKKQEERVLDVFAAEIENGFARGERQESQCWEEGKARKEERYCYGEEPVKQTAEQHGNDEEPGRQMAEQHGNGEESVKQMAEQHGNGGKPGRQMAEQHGNDMEPEVQITDQLPGAAPSTLIDAQILACQREITALLALHISGGNEDMLTYWKRRGELEDQIRSLQEKKKCQVINREKKQVLQALQELKMFVRAWVQTDDTASFPEETFRKLVNNCTVKSRQYVTFYFHCGLVLTESLAESLTESLQVQ